MGGKDFRHLPHTSLSVADFPLVKDEEFESYIIPADWKLESRPRDPPTYLSWQRQARNQVKTFCCIFGMEHQEERMAALDWSCNRYEGDEHKFPLDFIRGVLEELHWHWGESLREEIRRCKKVAGKDRLRREELEMLALTPTASGRAFFQFPK
eukprot:6425509-Amphidinium_carterae.1